MENIEASQNCSFMTSQIHCVSKNVKSTKRFQHVPLQGLIKVKKK